MLDVAEEHFWLLTYGTVVGTLKVRIRRDANEQVSVPAPWSPPSRRRVCSRAHPLLQAVLAAVRERMALVVAETTVEIVRVE